MGTMSSSEPYTPSVPIHSVLGTDPFTAIGLLSALAGGRLWMRYRTGTSGRAGEYESGGRGAESSASVRGRARATTRRADRWRRVGQRRASRHKENIEENIEEPVRDAGRRDARRVDCHARLRGLTSWDVPAWPASEICTPPEATGTGTQRGHYVPSCQYVWSCCSNRMSETC